MLPNSVYSTLGFFVSDLLGSDTGGYYYEGNATGRNNSAEKELKDVEVSYNVDYGSILSSDKDFVTRAKIDEEVRVLFDEPRGDIVIDNENRSGIGGLRDVQ